MSKFKEGDKVKIVAQINGHQFPLGEVVRIVKDRSYNYLAEYLDKSHSWYITEDEAESITTNNTIMTTLKQKFTNLFLSEPEKSYRKAGITNSDGILTSEGQEIFLTWLLKKNPEFKTEVVDQLLEEGKKD